MIDPVGFSKCVLNAFKSSLFLKENTEAEKSNFLIFGMRKFLQDYIRAT